MSLRHVAGGKGERLAVCPCNKSVVSQYSHGSQSPYIWSLCNSDLVTVSTSDHSVRERGQQDKGNKELSGPWPMNGRWRSFSTFQLAASAAPGGDSSVKAFATRQRQPVNTLDLCAGERREQLHKVVLTSIHALSVRP